VVIAIGLHQNIRGKLMNDIEIENIYNEIVGNLGRSDTRELIDMNMFVGDEVLGEFIERRGFEEIGSSDRRKHMLELIRYVKGENYDVV
jgi:hypothetical protein